MTTPPAVAAQRQVAEAQSRRRELSSRLADHSRRRGSSLVDPATPSGRIGTFHRDSISRRSSYVQAKYYDRPDLIRHDYRHTHTYYDRYHRLHHRVIWPQYHYPVYYRFGPSISFRHVYPYYHRKYVFISLGGYWPSDYLYTRYYWYGWHPYVWYGYYPIAREVVTPDQNYYTYNYYYQNSDGGYTSYSSETPVENEVRPVDQSTWADVRAKLDQQNAEPAPQTVADTRFEEGVKSFEAGNYDAAAEKFEEAMRLSPDDMILPFAYSQALFANGRYTESADILRTALSKASPEKEGVFYPRGLYANDDVLFAQVENLVDKLDQFGYDADMQLLLGYHLLGLGETGHAREPLERASQDLENAEPAKVLLKLLEKIESEAAAASKAGDVTVETPDVAAESDSGTQAESTPVPQTEATTGGAQPLGAPSAPAQGAPDAQPQDTPNPDKTDDAAPGGQSDAADPVKPEPSAGDTGGSAAPIMQQGDSGPSDKGPGSSGAVGAALMHSSSDALAGLSRYLKADFAIYAGIVLLGWTAVYVQWKLVNRV